MLPQMAESILCLLGIAVDDVHWPDYLALALELKPWEEVLATFDEDVGVSAEDRLKVCVSVW